MSRHPGKVSGFWNELKRRKVIKAATMYVMTAFIIMEAGEIMLPRLGLPVWTVTFLVVILIAGFPIMLIVSWIFDLTPDGVQKTENIDLEAPRTEEVQGSKRKIRASDLVIAILLVVVCTLIYPKLFKKDRLEEIRDEKGLISVAVMPFENLTGDSLYTTWQGGLQNLVISVLSNSSELQVRQYMTMSTLLGQKKNDNQASLSPTQARSLALNLDTRTFVLGNIMKAGEKIRINAQLLNSETEEIYKTYQVDGSTEKDLFILSDSLAGLIRNYLEIKKLAEGYDSPEVTQSAITHSAEAFRCYIRAFESFENLDIESTIQWLSKAVEIDPNFIEGYIFLSLTYASVLESKQSEYWCDRGYEKREQAPLRGQLYLDHLHAYHYETPYEEIRYCKQLLEIDDMNTTYWLMLGDAYNKLVQYQEAVHAFEKVLEIHEKWGTHVHIPHLYYWMSEALHSLGNHKRENEILEMGTGTVPNDGLLRRYQAICALSLEESDLAASYIEEYRSIRSAEGWHESRILRGIGLCYYFAGQIDQAEKYFRQSLDLDPDNPYGMHRLAMVLIRHDLTLEKGMELAEKAVKLKPDYFDILHTYGIGLYKQGKYEKALKILQKAWEVRGPYDPDLKRDMEAVEEALQNS